MNEQELREQIAKEIEAIHSECWSFSDCTCNKAVDIARGKRD